MEVTEGDVPEPYAWIVNIESNLIEKNKLTIAATDHINRRPKETPNKDHGTWKPQKRDLTTSPPVTWCAKIRHAHVVLHPVQPVPVVPRLIHAIAIKKKTGS
jgi:hypothetical protein